MANRLDDAGRYGGGGGGAGAAYVRARFRRRIAEVCTNAPSANTPRPARAAVIGATPSRNRPRASMSPTAMFALREAPNRKPTAAPSSAPMSDMMVDQIPWPQNARASPTMMRTTPMITPASPERNGSGAAMSATIRVGL